MTGFFNRLVQRSQSQIPVARPVLTSRFATMASMEETGTFGEAMEPESAVLQSIASVSRQVDRPRLRGKMDDGPNRGRSRRPRNLDAGMPPSTDLLIKTVHSHSSQSEAVDNQNRTANENASNRQPSLTPEKSQQTPLETIPVMDRFSQSAPDSQFRAETVPTISADEPLVPIANKKARERQSMEETQNFHAAAQPPASVRKDDQQNPASHNNKPDLEKTIEITIGKIEVRAVQPLQKNPVTPQTNPDNTLSLSNYLAERGRGER